jgi:hypothetical protein
MAQLTMHPNGEIRGTPDEQPAGSHAITLIAAGNFMTDREPELKSDLEAQFDELGTNLGQVGDRSAGHAGDSQSLSSEEDATEESVEELADTDQAFEAPERPLARRDKPAAIPRRWKSAR